MATNTNEYMREWRRKHGQSPEPVQIKVKEDGEGRLRFNLLKYLRAITRQLEYEFEGLPEGVTITDLENQIQGGNYEII